MADAHARIRDQLNEMKVMIKNGSRTGEVILYVRQHPEVLAHIRYNGVNVCDNLIYPTAEWETMRADWDALLPQERVGKADKFQQKRRSKIVCDFLIYWSKDGNNIDEFIGADGQLIPGAHERIQDIIRAGINELAGLNAELAAELAGIPAAGIPAVGDMLYAGIVGLTERIKTTSANVCAFAGLIAGTVSVACKSVGGVVVDTTAATVDAIDKLLGQLLQFNIITGIDIPAAAGVSQKFIESIAGEQTDTIILMLEGLLTVCAGTVAVKNYDAVFDAILKILNEMEGLIRVGVASTILYGIGTVMELLSKKLAAETGEKINMLQDKSTQIAAISRRTRNTHGTDVTAETIRVISDDIRAVVEGPAVEPQVAAVEVAAQPTPVEDVAPVEDAVKAAEREAAKQRQEAAREAERRAAAALAAQRRAAVREEEERNDRGHHGGKKRAKSQKRPRKKASKSKRSKKAGKSTRKRSRGKSHGKSHGKKH